jgi:tetratricopeptide (TPR) repeat protein
MTPRSLVLPALAVLLLPALGCNKVRARVELKEGNNLYQGEQYKPALDKFQKGLALDPSATFAWRSVGLTALALYRPGDENPKNKEYGTTAISAFEKYLADFPDDEKVKDYLLTSYVNEKQYDRALQFVDQLGQKDPADPKINNYKITILMQAGRLAEAFEVAKKVQGDNRLEVLANLGQSAWSASYRDTKYSLQALADATPENRDRLLAEKAKLVDMGLEAEKIVMDTKPEPDNADAVVFYNLLLREKAKLELDGDKKLALLADADKYLAKATELKKQAKEKAARQAKEDAAKTATKA